MKVFKMNDCDWVAAESEEQAKGFYEKETGFTQEEIAEEFEGEVSLSEEMFIFVDELPAGELVNAREVLKHGNSLIVSKPFSWVIENEKITNPCIICTTEI